MAFREIEEQYIINKLSAYLLLTTILVIFVKKFKLVSEGIIQNFLFPCIFAFLFL